jgi:hypothetical protein
MSTMTLDAVLSISNFTTHSIGTDNICERYIALSQERGSRVKMRGTVIESEKVLFQTRRYPKPKLGACALGINDDLNSSITEALTFFLPILKRSLSYQTSVPIDKS